MQDIANATHNYEEFKEVMAMIYKRVRFCHIALNALLYHIEHAR